MGATFRNLAGDRFVPLDDLAAQRQRLVDGATLARWISQGADDAGRPLKLLDTRDDFEVDAGAFDSTVDWRLREFADFPARLAAHQADFAGHTVVRYSTGGIRCEKDVLVMQALGLGHSYQRDCGILKYFDDTAALAPCWHGRCFVLDARAGLDTAPAAYVPEFAAAPVRPAAVGVRTGATAAAGARPAGRDLGGALTAGAVGVHGHAGPAGALPRRGDARRPWVHRDGAREDGIFKRPVLSFPALSFAAASRPTEGARHEYCAGAGPPLVSSLTVCARLQSNWPPAADNTCTATSHFHVRRRTDTCTARAHRMAHEASPAVPHATHEDV